MRKRAFSYVYHCSIFPEHHHTLNGTIWLIQAAKMRLGKAISDEVIEQKQQFAFRIPLSEYGAFDKRSVTADFFNIQYKLHEKMRFGKGYLYYNSSVCRSYQTAGRIYCSIVSGYVLHCSYRLKALPLTRSRLSSA